MSDWVDLNLTHRGDTAAPRRFLVRGWFIERPHRFAARVRLADNSVVEAHLPNPGRLTGVLLPGNELSVEGPFPPPRVLPYSVLAARAGRIWVGTVPAYANVMFPRLLEAGLFPELAARRAGIGPGAGENTVTRPASGSRHAGELGATRTAARSKGQHRASRSGRRESDEAVLVRREVTHGRSRFDFEIDGRLVEVKSVSMAEGRAGLFPDAVTARGARHCGELAALARRGRRTAIVFVAQRADVASVAAAREVDPVFADALDAARRAGVLVLACALRMGLDGARAARRIPVL